MRLCPKKHFADLNGAVVQQIHLLHQAFVTFARTKAHEGDSWSLAHQISAVKAMKATEAPSLPFSDASLNGREGASSRSTKSNRRHTTLLRVAAHEGDESGFVPSHPRSDAGRTCVVKATESASSLTDALSPLRY